MASPGACCQQPRYVDTGAAAGWGLVAHGCGVHAWDGVLPRAHTLGHDLEVWRGTGRGAGEHGGRNAHEQQQQQQQLQQLLLLVLLPDVHSTEEGTRANGLDTHPGSPWPACQPWLLRHPPWRRGRWRRSGRSWRCPRRAARCRRRPFCRPPPSTARPPARGAPPRRRGAPGGAPRRPAAAARRPGCCRAGGRPAPRRERAQSSSRRARRPPTPPPAAPGRGAKVCRREWS